MDQERRLNLDLLKSGKFKDAVESLLTWMGDVKETLANQKTSSLDDKVIGSQLQTQKASCNLSAAENMVNFKNADFRCTV